MGEQLPERPQPLLAPDFATERGSLIFSGKPGRGKTHLAIAVAYRAIQNGFNAVFTTAATLIDDLSARAGPPSLDTSGRLGSRLGGVSHIGHRCGDM